MKFDSKLVHGKLIKRYKRFLADVELDNGEIITAHCTNSGSMKSCLETGAEVFLSPNNNPKRKTRFTWEMIKINKKWVGINTNVPNRFAFEAISAGQIPELAGYKVIEREKTFHNSRFDIKLSNETDICFVEVKNVSYKENRYALFPDAVTTRGKKHLEDLILAHKEGYRAVMLYIIQRMDVELFAPAYQIDKLYADTMVKAKQHGVELLAYQVEINPIEVRLNKKIEIVEYPVSKAL